MKACGFAGCDGRYFASGLCAAHWRQRKVNGVLKPRGGQAIPLAQRFEARITRLDSGCWAFRGSKAAGGYIRYSALGEHLAHRVAWRLWRGDLDPADGNRGMVVRHLCHRPDCVNPDHLSTGTQSDNMQDSLRDGRLAVGAEMSARVRKWVQYGERSHAAKLSDAQAQEIRDRRARGEKQADVALLFGVSQSTVSLISSGKRRKGPPGPRPG